jgi:HK97 family phage major capsid protein/HK97 family phage prohead protease
MSDKLNSLIGKSITRASTLTPINEDEESRSFELSFSSEEPIEDWPGMFTILSHDAGSVDLNRLNNGAPLLFNHNRGDHIGVVESARVDSDRRGRAVVRLSKSTRGEEIYQDIKDNVLRNVSVGLRIKELRFEAEEDEKETYRATKWEPYEISIVPIPADTNVGIGRGLNSTPPKFEIMADENDTVDPKLERQAGIDIERKRIQDLNSVGDQFGEQELAREYIVTGKSLDDFKDAVLTKRNQEHNQKLEQANQPIGLSEREKKDYSFIKVIRYLADPTSKRLREDASFEIECAEAANNKRVKESSTERGFMIPTDILRSPILNVKRGTNIIGIKGTGGYTGTGGNLVDTTLLSSSFIEILRNRAVLLRHATQIGGLIGDIDIPKELTSMTTAWIGEDEEAPQSDIDFGVIGLRNRTVSARGAVTRKMIKQSSIDIEALIRMSIARSIALEIDRAGLYGDGQNNQPIGIIGTNNINAVNFATDAKPTYAEIVEMETRVAADNADIGSMIYMLPATMRGHLKTTQKFTGTNGNPIWETGNTVNGYQTEVTNQLKSTDILYGNLSDLYVGMWGGLELAVDPYTESSKGRIKLNAFQDVDFELAREESFCLGRHTTA